MSGYRRARRRAWVSRREKIAEANAMRFLVRFTLHWLKQDEPRIIVGRSGGALFVNHERVERWADDIAFALPVNASTEGNPYSLGVFR